MHGDGLLSASVTCSHVHNVEKKTTSKPHASKCCHKNASSSTSQVISSNFMQKYMY